MNPRPKNTEKYRIESRLYELFIRKGRIVLSFFLIFPCHAQQHTKNGTVVLPVHYFSPFQPNLQTEVKVSVSALHPFVAPFFLPPSLPHFDRWGHCRYSSWKKLMKKSDKREMINLWEDSWNKKQTNPSGPFFAFSWTLLQFSVIIVCCPHRHRRHLPNTMANEAKTSKK